MFPAVIDRSGRGLSAIEHGLFPACVDGGAVGKSAVLDILVASVVDLGVFRDSTVEHPLRATGMDRGVGGCSGKVLPSVCTQDGIAGAATAFDRLVGVDDIGMAGDAATGNRLVCTGRKRRADGGSARADDLDRSCTGKRRIAGGSTVADVLFSATVDCSIRGNTNDALFTATVDGRAVGDA